jgi:peptide chain release factor 2
LHNCASPWRKWGIVFDLARRHRELDELEKVTEKPGFWDDPETAQKHMQRVNQARQAVEPWSELHAQLEDLETLAELAVEEQDEAMEPELQRGLEQARSSLADLELSTVLGGKYDRNNAILTVTAGAGGTEACDWAEMLLRMYTFWAENYRGYRFDVVSHVEGEAAGIRNATARVTGPMAYGYLKAEAGVHRLVRLSPFDSSKRRHTSFASVDVIPEVAEEDEIPIREEDLRIDTYRSSGAGGQHVNKTDSAVRITHIPTGIVVQCQNERSQHSNKRTAMQILQARLYELEQSKHSQEIQGLRGEKGDIAFANQIRSYVMQPYTMVKDHRTGVETSDVEGVLNGDLQVFIRAYLQWLAGQGGEGV